MSDFIFKRGKDVLGDKFLRIYIKRDNRCLPSKGDTIGFAKVSDDKEKRKKAFSTLKKLLIKYKKGNEK